MSGHARAASFARAQPPAPMVCIVFAYCIDLCNMYSRILCRIADVINSYAGNRLSTAVQVSNNMVTLFDFDERGF